MLTKEGIVIKSNKYQEASKIIHVLTKDGMESFLVRSANNFKSKNYSYAQEVTKISFDTSKKNSFEILTTGMVLDNYSNIKLDSKRLFDICEIIEMIYSLSSHVNDNKVFYDFVCNVFNSINNDYNRYYLIIFKVKLLYLLGVGPQFKEGCAICGKNELYAFDLEAGKAFCKEHFHLTDVSLYDSEFEVFRFLYLAKYEYLTNEVLIKLPNYVDYLDEFLNKYYDYYLGYKGKVRRIVKKI